MRDPEFDEPEEERYRETPEDRADRIYHEIKDGDRPRPWWWPESWKTTKEGDHETEADDGL